MGQGNIAAIRAYRCLAGLETVRDIEILRRVTRRYPEPLAQLRFFTVLCEVDAVDRADVHARVALDAERPREHRLHVTVEAPLGLLGRELVVVTKLDLHLQVPERPG